MRWLRWGQHTHKLAAQNDNLHVDVFLSTPSTLPEGVSTTTVFDAATSRGAIRAIITRATTMPRSRSVDDMVMANAEISNLNSDSVQITRSIDFFFPKIVFTHCRASPRPQQRCGTNVAAVCALAQLVNKAASCAASTAVSKNRLIGLLTRARGGCNLLR
jgi:hypothetical protein